MRTLIPFFLIWRVPIIGDFLLIAFISWFPGLLPSTFKLVKQVSGTISSVNRLQPTLEEKVKALKIKQLSLLPVGAEKQIPEVIKEKLPVSHI